MLVAADIAKGDPGNASIRYPLEVERPAAPAEDLDGLAASSDQQNRAFRDENLVLVDPRPDEDLIVRTCVFDSGAGPSIGGGIGRVHYQRVAAGRVGRGILPQRLGIRRKVLLDVDPIGLQLVGRLYGHGGGFHTILWDRLRQSGPWYQVSAESVAIPRAVRTPISSPGRQRCMSSRPWV